MRRAFAMGMMAMGLLVSGLAKADHTSPSGSVGLLVAETEELEQAVRYSGLRYNVQDAVFRFSSDVRRLADCQRMGPRPIYNDHLDDTGCHGSCQRELMDAQLSFRSVSRYLWDTNYDYPAVYNAFRSVERALNAISVSPIPGPGPGPGPLPGGMFQCTAVDRGWEEHFGGHRGFGRSVMEAQAQALRECERMHGRCLIRRCDRM